jgi:hypothetical protein
VDGVGSTAAVAEEDELAPGAKSGGGLLRELGDARDQIVGKRLFLRGRSPGVVSEFLQRRWQCSS